MLKIKGTPWHSTRMRSMLISYRKSGGLVTALTLKNGSSRLLETFLSSLVPSPTARRTDSFPSTLQHTKLRVTDCGAVAFPKSLLIFKIRLIGLSISISSMFELRSIISSLLILQKSWLEMPRMEDQGSYIVFDLRHMERR